MLNLLLKYSEENSEYFKKRQYVELKAEKFLNFIFLAFSAELRNMYCLKILILGQNFRNDYKKRYLPIIIVYLTEHFSEITENVWVTHYLKCVVKIQILKKPR